MNRPFRAQNGLSSMIFCYPKADNYGLLVLSTQTCLIVDELDLHKAPRSKFLYEMFNNTSSARCK